MSRSTHYIRRTGPHDYESSSDERFDGLDVHYPVCYLFESNSEDGKLCGCNRAQKYHEPKPRTGRRKLEKIGNLKWDRRSHVRPMKDEAHGRLINGALYARIDMTTDLDIVRQLLSDVWKFPKPKTIMSIIGGSKDFALSDRLETSFINGIMNTAIRSDIWMITTGYNNGLVQLLGQAFYKAKIKEPKKIMIALAICKWGSVKNPENLIKRKKQKPDQQKKWYTNDNLNDEDEIEAQTNDEHELNMHHSHYLMLDDAIYRHLDTEDYRTRLCSYIAEIDDKNLPITPAVTLVVGGGNATISNIYYDLKSNIPVVIIEGSGRVADFFSRWLIYTKEFDKDSKGRKIIYGIDELISTGEVTEIMGQQTLTTTDGRLCRIDIELGSKRLTDIFTKHKTKLEKDLEKILYDDHNSDKEKDQGEKPEQISYNGELKLACEQVMFCLQSSIRSNISVFNLNSDNDLSETIFKSIATSYKNLIERKKDEPDIRSNDVPYDSKKKDQGVESPLLLDLAMDWNCIDGAKEFVLQNSLENIPDIGEVFKKALKNDLYTFVYEFIKLGVNPADIFFPRNTFTKEENRYKHFIEYLYDDKIVSHPKTHLKLLIKEHGSFDQAQIVSTQGLNAILCILIGDYMHKLYFDSLQEDYDDRAKRGLTTRSEKSKDFESIQTLTYEKEKQMEYDYIMRDLFIWSILMNYTDMAKVLLSHMKYRICPALIATKILKTYHRKAVYGELKDGYLKSATYFEQYAIDCLDKCDDHSVDKACEIILLQNELYGYVTCLQVADDAEDKLFIAAPCSVQAMNNVWFDKLNPERRKRDMFKWTFGFLTLGLGAPLLVQYREYKQGGEVETLKPVLNSGGINYYDPYPLEHPRYSKNNLLVNRYLHKVANFHQSLLMKFCYHLITYCFFLLLFSYVLLFNFEPPSNQIPSIHWTEILTIMLVSCMLIGEIHYFITQDSFTFPGKLRNYSRDLFKTITIIAFILFYIGLIVRFTNGGSEVDFTAARVIMAIDIELWWFRLLSFIIVIPQLGPQLVAIRKMLRDLLFFICIILIVMIGYGVASRSMVYYPKANNFTTETGGFIDSSFDGRAVFRQILYPVYYFLHGAFYDDELTNLDSNPNAGWSIATQVLLAFHMMFVNILLVNLLIAIFSKRFDQVHEDIQNIWYSQQYLYTREYFTRSPFVPPISLIYDIYFLCRIFLFFLRRKCDISEDRNARVFKMIPTNEGRIKELYQFEGASTYVYAHAEVKALKAALTKSTSGQDSANAENKENIINNEKDRSNVVESLKLVHENVTRLYTKIEELKAECFKTNTGN